MSRLRIALATTSLVVGLAACAGGGTTTNTQASTSAPSAEAPAALQFTASAVGGDSIDFTQFAGQTVALWFWAPT